MDLKEMQEMHREHNQWKEEIPWKAWGSWFSWGSPVGLGLFFLEIGIFAVLIRYAFIMR